MFVYTLKIYGRIHRVASKERELGIQGIRETYFPSNIVLDRLTLSNAH